MPDDYEVGYGQPPRQSQFRPGQSGNPRGRPRGSRNLRTDLDQELRSRVTVREGGREVRVSKQRAMIKALIAKSIQGEPRAVERLVDLMLRLLAEREQTTDDAKPISSEEQEILDHLASRYMSQPVSGNTSDAGVQSGAVDGGADGHRTEYAPSKTDAEGDTSV